jgi:hypothetical protein
LSSLSSHASCSSPAEPSTSTRPPPGSGDAQQAAAGGRQVVHRETGHGPSH